LSAGGRAATIPRDVFPLPQ